jgi:hypothetical protein
MYLLLSLPLDQEICNLNIFVYLMWFRLSLLHQLSLSLWSNEETLDKNITRKRIILWHAKLLS